MQVALVDGRLFPYFVEPLELIRRRYGVDPVTLASRLGFVLERGFERLREAVVRGRAPRPAERLEDEVLSFLFASLLALASGSRWLVSRLALAEAERGYQQLLSAPDEVVSQVARLTGLRSVRFRPGLYREPIALVNGVPVYREFNFSVSFVEYVSAARRLLGDQRWKPVNLPVRRGEVYLDKARMARLVKETLMVYVENLIIGLAGKVDVDGLRRLAAGYLEKIGELEKPRLRGGGRVRVEKGVIVEEAFPPCMAEILARARRGEHLSHHERFAIATFLLNIGADVDRVVDVFRSMPDFNERITRYQVEHLAGLRGSGKRYRTYSCETMRSLGLCRADCGTRSPVQAYYRNLRSASRGEAGDGGDKQSQRSRKG